MDTNLTTALFWDCECEREFIHTRYEAFCPLCHSYMIDQPDSRWKETIGVLDDLLAEDETRYCLSAPEVYALEMIRDHLIASDAEKRGDQYVAKITQSNQPSV